MLELMGVIGCLADDKVSQYFFTVIFVEAGNFLFFFKFSFVSLFCTYTWPAEKHLQDRTSGP